MDAASVVCEFRIRKMIELGAGEMPSIEAYEDCGGLVLEEEVGMGSEGESQSGFARGRDSCDADQETRGIRSGEIGLFSWVGCITIRTFVAL